MDNITINVLLESRSARESQLANFSDDRALETLNKAKALVMALWHGKNIATTEQIAEYYQVPTETILSLVKLHRSEFQSDGLRIIQGAELKEHKLNLHLCCNSARLAIWTPRSALRAGMLLRDSVVAKEVRNVLLDIAESSNTINSLEQQFIPEISLKEIREYLDLMGDIYGDTYKQRLAPIVVKKFRPYLPIISAAPEEQASLPAKSLLNPTQIAEQLGFVYSTGKPNPQAVNKLLELLGYQEKISSQWSATDKAIKLGLCDRKPVNTNSRTQKDQLLWSVDVIPILQEYTTSKAA